MFSLLERQFPSLLFQPEDPIQSGDGDPLFESISKLGSNAKTRYLTAKIRVMEEDNEKLQAELRSTVSTHSNK